MADIKQIQFLRNSVVSDDKVAAKQALENKKGEMLDGSLVLNRYTEDAKTKTLFGLYYNDGTNQTCTVFEDVPQIPTPTGENVILEGYTGPATETRAITDTDSVNDAFGILEKKIDDAVAGGVTSIVAGNGIVVDTTDPQTTATPKVGVKLDTTNNNLLDLDTNGLSAKIGLAAFIDPDTNKFGVELTKDGTKIDGTFVDLTDVVMAILNQLDFGKYTQA